MSTTYTVTRGTGASGSQTLSGSGASRTFSFTPGKVGNLIFFFMGWGNATNVFSGASSTNATWATAFAPFTNTGLTFIALAAVATSTSAATVTFTWTATITASIQVDVIEISANDLGLNPGTWNWGSNNVNILTAGTTSCPGPVCPVLSGDDLYVCWFFPATTGTAGTNGTPAGFVYGASTTNNNFLSWNLAYGVSAAVSAQTQTSGAGYVAIGFTPFFLTRWVPSTIGGSN